MPAAAGHPPGKPIEPRLHFLPGQLPLHLTNRDARHAVGMTPGHLGVDLRITFARVTHEQKLPPRKIRHDVFDGPPLRTLAGRQPSQRRGILEAEELEVHGAQGEA